MCISLSLLRYKYSLFYKCMNFVSLCIQGLASDINMCVYYKFVSPYRYTIQVNV